MPANLKGTTDMSEANIPAHPVVLLGRVEGLTVTPWGIDCPCCGLDLSDCFYVEEWGQAYCEECLEDEILKQSPSTD